MKILSIPQKSTLIKGIEIAKEHATEISKELGRLVPKNSGAAKRLDVFTVAETGIFLDHLCRQANQAPLLTALKRFADSTEFGQIVETWAANDITLRTGSRTLDEFQEDRRGSRRQYYPGQN